MKKLLILAATGGALLLAAPAQADASSYLPMWQAKQQAYKDIREIASPDPFTYRCWRWSGSRVRCKATVYPSGMTCTATYQWYKSVYSGALFERTVVRPRCW